MGPVPQHGGQIAGQLVGGPFGTRGNRALPEEAVDEVGVLAQERRHAAALQGIGVGLRLTEERVVVSDSGGEYGKARIGFNAGFAADNLVILASALRARRPASRAEGRDITTHP